MITTRRLECTRRFRRYLGRTLGALLLAFPLAGLAETLMMPDRDGLVGQNIVVWGVTTLANGTNYTLDCGNGVITAAAPVADRSYIPVVCNYAAQGVYDAKLTVGAEQATAKVAIYNGATLSASDLRGVQINMTIEDGLRYLWTNQNNRAANFPASVTTLWNNSGFAYADTSLVVLAFQNHGYSLPNSNAAPTGLYEKYIVRRGLNYVMSNLSAIALGVTPQGDNPCVGSGAGWNGSDCVGLQTPGDQGYSIALAMLPFASSGALARQNTEVAGATANKTYGEILQRLTNALAWGQIDQNSANGRGGWYYTLNSTTLDGSTVGWDILGFLDAAAAGATVPPWVATEFKFGFDKALNNDGTVDYNGDGNPAFNNSVGPQKNGIGLQGLYWIGETSGARVTTVTNTINSWWSGAGGTGGNSWGGCPTGNKSCAYTMFNNFKGLKLHGIQTLPAVGRPAGPGAIPANDWHEDYKDWLIANQSAPTTTGGGSWGPAMGFSCCASGDAIETAVAELLLSEVALVLPDPIQFGEIGLQHCLDGVPCTNRTPEVDGESTEDTNPVGTAHSVVAIAKSINGDPIPGTTINIAILSGPNAPQNFQGVSNASGEVKITYTSNGTAGTDELRASIGNLNSNSLTKIWEQPTGGLACDIDDDGDVDRNDILAISAARNQPALPGDPRDHDRNGKINVNDARQCTLLCTLPRCASPAPT